jgi:hypothetical protein
MENKNLSAIKELYKDLDIAANIKKKRLEGIGHVVRIIMEGQ